MQQARHTGAGTEHWHPNGFRLYFQGPHPERHRVIAEGQRVDHPLDPECVILDVQATCLGLGLIRRDIGSIIGNGQMFAAQCNGSIRGGVVIGRDAVGLLLEAAGLIADYRTGRLDALLQPTMRDRRHADHRDPSQT